MIIAPQFLFTLEMMLADYRHLEFMGGIKAEGGETSISTTVKNREGYLIFGRVSGLSATDKLALRFNGISTNSYHWRNFTAPEVLGAVTFGNAQSGAGGADRMVIEDVSTALNRHFLIIVYNSSTQSKVIFYQSTIGTGSLTTQPTAQLGTAEWVDATTAINSVALTTLGGVVTFNVGTSFGVFGGDIISV